MSQHISHPSRSGPGYSQRVKIPLCLNPEGTLEVIQTNFFHFLLRKQRCGASTPPVWGSLYHYILVQLYLSQTFMHFFDQLCECSIPRFIQHGCWSSIIQSLHGLPRRSFQQPALHLKKPTVSPVVIQHHDLQLLLRKSFQKLDQLCTGTQGPAPNHRREQKGWPPSALGYLNWKPLSSCKRQGSFLKSCFFSSLSVHMEKELCGFVKESRLQFSDGHCQ